MTHVHSPLRSRLAQHWFIPVALFILCGAVVAARTAEWAQEAVLIEAALLFDLAILLPVLYFVCYRLRGKASGLKALALACSGICVATWLVPQEQQSLLPAFAFLRYGAIAVLVYIEVRVVAALYWAIIVGAAPADEAATQLSDSLGVPDRVAGLMAKEALFWRRVLARPIGVLRRYLQRGNRF